MGQLLKGKATVVTGTGGDCGIGRAIALAFASEGASVVVNDFAQYEDGTKMADTVVQQIVENGGQAVANYDSVATMDGGKNIIQTCIDHFGKIDILVNTAGNHIGGLIEEATEEQLDFLYQVHMKGHFACTQAAVKEMRKQGNGGSIINFSSPSAFGGEGAQGWQLLYGSIKAAILGFTQHLSVGLANDHIRVNAIMPAVISKLNTSATQFLDMGDGLPYTDGYQSAEHISDVVLYLASDTSQHITGKYLYIRSSDICSFARPCSIIDSQHKFFRKANGEHWTQEELAKLPL